MRLRNLLFIVIYIFGSAIALFSSYWYLIVHHDPSQFIAFLLLGSGVVLVGAFAQIVLIKLEKLHIKMEIFEDRLLDRFPQLRK